MDKEKRTQKVKFCIIISIIIIAIAFAIFTVLKYQVEGEKNMPFNLGKIIVISSACTVDTNSANENVEIEQQENYIWNEKVIQTNDVYMYLDKNLNYKEDEIIKNVRIENIQILEKANIGKIQVYMPNSLDDGLYKYANDFLVNSSLTYKGANADNKKTLEIGNQGGCICISFANVEVGKFQSNDDKEVKQGTSLLEKIGVSDEDLKFKVSFDIIIEVKNESYKANIILDLPVDGMIEQEKNTMEITDFSNVVFRRM